MVVVGVVGAEVIVAASASAAAVDDNVATLIVGGVVYLRENRHCIRHPHRQIL